MAGAESSDEQRATQLAKRVEGISALQRTPAYIVVKSHGSELPPAPDPHDGGMSKRTWEKSMMRWRAALRDALHQIHSEAAAREAG